MARDDNTAGAEYKRARRSVRASRPELRDRVAWSSATRRARHQSSSSEERSSSAERRSASRPRRRSLDVPADLREVSSATEPPVAVKSAAEHRVARSAIAAARRTRRRAPERVGEQSTTPRAMSPLEPASTRIEASTVPMHGAAQTANAPPSSTAGAAVPGALQQPGRHGAAPARQQADEREPDHDEREAGDLRLASTWRRRSRSPPRRRRARRRRP